MQKSPICSVIESFSTKYQYISSFALFSILFNDSSIKKSQMFSCTAYARQKTELLTQRLGRN